MKSKPHKVSGFVRFTMGQEKLLDGTVQPARFYVGKEEEQVEKNKARLRLEWSRVEQQGYQWWPDEIITRLITDGVITRRRQKPSTAVNMLGVVPKGMEIVPFVDEATGLVRPEVAPQLLELIAQKLIATKDSQIRFAEAFHAEFVKDPLTAFERASRVFGWGKDDVRQVFNIGTATQASPIVFNAAEERRKAIVGKVVEKTGDNAVPTDSNN